MTVLVAYDGSGPAQQAVDHAIETHGDEDIILLRVVELADGSTSAGINLAQEALKKRREKVEEQSLDELEALLDREDIDISLEITMGRPDREIVDYAEENDIDHIIIGSQGRSGVSRVLLGSIAERVVRRASVPVTVVR